MDPWNQYKRGWHHLNTFSSWTFYRIKEGNGHEWPHWEHTARVWPTVGLRDAYDLSLPGNAPRSLALQGFWQ